MTTHEQPLTAAQLRLPAPVARYVRSHPFSVGLSVVLVATGLSFLSVSHPRTSQELAS